MAAHLECIYIYPVKGLRRVALQEAQVEPQGLAHDRRWMLVGRSGTFLSQRQVASLALLRAAIAPEGIRVSARGAPDLVVARPQVDAPRLTVTIWGDTLEAACAAPEADRWFTAVTGQPCRPVFMDDAATRRVNAAYDPGGAVVSFADSYPLLLTSVQSLTDLNSRMVRPLSMNRFRPNIVVNGFAPFAEDGWHELQIGSMRFHVVKPCQRCVVTTIDQESSKGGTEPLRTLNTFRKRGGKVYFGENLIPQGQGTVRVGDPVTVAANRTPAQRTF